MDRAYRSPSVVSLGKADVLTIGLTHGKTVEPKGTHSTSVSLLDL
jgi:hypothetical protein